nr:group II intron maturase-specific domain-containing protein [Atopobacter sp. AH10]
MQYFGTGFIKRYIQNIESCLHRRMRQQILKRWKKCRTKIERLIALGLDLDSAKRIGFSRKKYWCLARTPELHRAITKEKLYQWGLVNLVALAERVYLTY